jgi:hypothetical protein
MIIKWKYKPTGFFPIQSEGYFLGYYFYFRSRWETATIEFSKTKEGWDNDLIHARYVLANTPEYKAGCMDKRKCLFLIYLGCLLFLFKINKNKTITQRRTKIDMVNVVIYSVIFTISFLVLVFFIWLIGKIF